MAVVPISAALTALVVTALLQDADEWAHAEAGTLLAHIRAALEKRALQPPAAAG